MIFSIIFLVIGIASLLFLFFSKVGVNKARLFKIIGFAMVLSACGALAKADLSLFHTYLIMAIFALVTGFVYNHLVIKPVNENNDVKPLHNIALVAAPLFIAVGVFNYTFQNFHHAATASVLLSSAYLAFIFPMIFMSAFTALVSIPKLDYPVWHFPQYIDFDFDTVDTSDLMLVNINTKISETDPELTNFKVKAPKAIAFQYFFIKFISDYNNRSPESQINPWYSGDRLIAWRFFVKPRWFEETRYIDPVQSMQANKLKERNQIIVERVFV